MWRILLVACLWLLDCPDSSAQVVLIARYTFAGNTTQAQFVHEAALAHPMVLTPTIPVICASCHVDPGNLSSSPGYGTYGWSNQTNSPDLSQYNEIPQKVAPGHGLELGRMSFEIHRESQRAQKCQAWYSEINYSNSPFSDTVQNTNSWPTVTTPLTSLQHLQRLCDSVIFRLYPFDVKKGLTKDNQAIARLHFVRIDNAWRPLQMKLTFLNTSLDTKIFS